MGKQVRRSCGVLIRAEDNAELVATVRKHAREVHDQEAPEAEQVLAMAEPDGGAPAAG